MPSANGQETKAIPSEGAAQNANGPVKKKKKNRIRPKRPKIAAKQANSLGASTIPLLQENFIKEVCISVSDNIKTTTIQENMQVNSSKECNSQAYTTPKSDTVKSAADSLKNQEKSNKIKAVPAAAEKINGELTAKSREQVMAEREAKKLSKQIKKLNSGSQTAHVAPTVVSPTVVSTSETSALASKPEMTAQNITPQSTSAAVNTAPAANATSTPAFGEKSREQIKAEREAKKLLKQAIKTSKQNVAADVVIELTQKMSNVKISPVAATVTSTITATATESAESAEKKKPALTKAERRAIQEAQRAAKSKALTAQTTCTANAESNKALTKKALTPATSQAALKPRVTSPSKSSASPVKVIKVNECNVKLFNHLVKPQKDVNLFVNNSQIHPIIARLGEQYAKRTVVGSNARCIAFLNALKIIVQDFVTPPKKEFSRSLEAFIKNCVDHLHNCRPLAVSVSNAYKHIKHVLTQLTSDQPETELKAYLCHFIDTYLENQIGKAALAISCSMQEKISNGDVILTFGCSSLINYIFEEAHRRHIDFRVIIVDSRPFCEGQELLRRLCAKEISCTYVLINAVSFVMPEVTKVLLGAHALLSNGYVMARTGTAQVALVARSCNVPVLVCCETHKFSERFQTDAIVYNELGNPDDLILSDKCCLTNWQAKTKMSPLNLNYDITPPELVTAVVTEVSILPCTSVPVILRIKPTEIGYYN